jgi:hypothetical protein
MAVHHMVWIKFRLEVSPERIAAHMAALAGLRQRIPEIIDLHAGTNITDRARGYTHGLIVVVEDADALQRYLDHPEHVAVARPLKEDADVVAMDIAD